jgi:flagellar biogenesis protein FliO
MRSRCYIPLTFVVALFAGALAVGFLAGTSRADAATSDLAPESAVISPDKEMSAKTVLGDEPIRTDVSPDSGTSSPVPSVQPQGMDFPRVLAALGIVIGLILVLRWCGRIFFPGVTGRPANRAIEVISRSPVSPKQQVLLIRVGRRLLVVADTGSRMNALCEINDPDEIASLVGQLREEKSSVTSRPFGAIFGLSRRVFESAADVAPVDEVAAALRQAEEDPLPATSAREELNGLRDRVRMLAEQFKAG